MIFAIEYGVSNWLLKREEKEGEEKEERAEGEVKMERIQNKGTKEANIQEWNMPVALATGFLLIIPAKLLS